QRVADDRVDVGAIFIRQLRQGAAEIVGNGQFRGQGRSKSQFVEGVWIGKGDRRRRRDCRRQGSWQRRHFLQRRARQAKRLRKRLNTLDQLIDGVFAQA